ncbi:hypothetical protein [Ulvibacterium sp.]|uniref:hypothetical protein n=1 Tax=Ulvibacterium sp. TaxID=2665914 RepID=UPI002608613C|nr:hypothetical protein [Ulvibacterium sp.]
MAGGGIAGANTSLKNNRKLLKRRKLREKGDVYGQEGVTKLNLKESTDQDMKRIQKRIKEYKREARTIWFIAICVTAFIVYSIWWWASS